MHTCACEKEREKEKRFNGSGFLSLNFDDVHNTFKSLSYLKYF